MATLKTNYKDDIFSGNRKYNMISNGDGTVSFIDMTTYSQVGDAFAGADINATNLEVNSHEADYTLQIPYASTTAGAANAYTIASPAITAYVTGMAVTVKIHAASTAASTLNWNGKGAIAIKRSDGSAISTQLKLNGVYTLRYDGTNFILQGEGGSGTAVASDLLSGKTATTDAGDITGTIASKSAATYNPSTSAQTITSGQYLSGTQTIAATTGTAVAADVLSGKTFNSAAGIAVSGTIASKGAQTYTPGTSVQTVAAGQYLSGIQTISGDANLVTANVLAGASIFGVAGSAKRVVSGTLTSGTSTANYTYAVGSGTDNKYTFTVSGLTFTPSCIMITAYSGGYQYTTLYTTQATTIYAKTVFVFICNNNSAQFNNFAYRADTSPAYVNATGFSLPIFVPNTSHYWIAIE